jgi:hypothetical protein
MLWVRLRHELEIYSERQVKETFEAVTLTVEEMAFGPICCRLIPAGPPSDEPPPRPAK